jgi:histone-lysine N-methyltransferase SETMAR
VYRYEKGESAMKMHQKLLARNQATCPAYSTVTNWIRSLERGDDIFERASGSGRRPNEELIGLIFAVLEQEPFHSVRSLATAVKSPPTTVWRSLHSSGFVLRNLRLVPHALSPSEKASRVDMAIQLKKSIETAKHQGWRFFLTGDESWFYFTTDYEHMWTPEGATLPTRVRRTVASAKRMLTVFWSPLGFPVIKALPKGMRFNAEYFCSVILREIDANRPSHSAVDRGRNLVLHFDNATVHTARCTQEFMRENRMRRAPHPPFSPDLAPSDFYLFGKVKTALRGQIFEEENELVAAVREVLATISRDELESVFADWLRRLDECVQKNGDYVE